MRASTHLAASTDTGSTVLPRISFGVIVLNGEPFTRYCLRSLYPFAHEIIVVEGAHRDAAALASLDGHSIDGTLEALHRFQREEDPEGKVRIITRDGFWPDVAELDNGTGRTRTSQSRAYAEVATGDYLWQVDIDEFYLPRDVEAIRQMLAADPGITAVSFPFVDFWARPEYAVRSWKYHRSGVAHRLFKWEKGYAYTRHRPPTVVDRNGRNLRAMRWLTPADIGRMGIRMHHYSHLFPAQIRRKVAVYQAELPEYFPALHRWMDEGYFGLQRPHHVEYHYWVPACLERFSGEHPPEVSRMMDDIERGVLDVELRHTDDIERLLHKWWYPPSRSLVQGLEPLDRFWHYARPRAVNLAHGRVPTRVRRWMHSSYRRAHGLSPGTETSHGG